MDGPVLRLFRLVNPQKHSLFTHGDPCDHPILPQCESQTGGGEKVSMKLPDALHADSL